MIDVVVVDDHELLGELVADALALRTGLRVTSHRPRDLDDAHRHLTGIRPRVAVLDLDLGFADGIELVPSLLAAALPVVVCTGVRDRLRWAECLAAGAAAVVSKERDLTALAGAVTAVLAGVPATPPADRQQLLAELRTARRRRTAELGPFADLTTREADVLAALVDGRSVAGIASERVVAVSTVRSQVRAILRKLGVNSQLEAIARARQVGWQPPGAEPGRPAASA